MIDSRTLAALKHLLRGDSGTGAGMALVVVHGRRITSIAWVGGKQSAETLEQQEQVSSNGHKPVEESRNAY